MRWNYRDAGLLVPVLLAIAAGPAFADTIVNPSTAPNAFATASYGNWYVPCDYEYGAAAYTDFQCGSYFETLLSSVSTQLNSSITGLTTGSLVLTSVPDADFAYQEVDTYSSATGAYDEPVDFVIFNNSEFGPVTFTFTGVGGGAENVFGLMTNIYGWSPFTATASAYDNQGNFLGSVSFNSVENDQELYLSAFNPTYSAVVGALDINNANIASVVVSTTPTTPDGIADAFGIGFSEVEPVPEPRTFVPVLLSAAFFLMCRNRPRAIPAALKQIRKRTTR